MTKVPDWRNLVYHGSRIHLEEALTAALHFIREHHPDATLEYLGSDWGGEMYRVTEKEEEC